ncbi:U6 snRNA-associated Sm-like protein LSm8 [Smittium culicis]|uniref:LSM2-LSM8 complex subunit LSM8 n=1 Tax=Smittium culicis TaxID=133412 RepID=A0A1R1Y4C4_9FUNG|nr:U6 snRNA-associated Sm-like protein LSm8 [Smittium culicis]
MSELHNFVEKKVSGTLTGFDSNVNLILVNTVERVFSEDSPVEFVDVGLYLVRGDEVAIIGLVDDELDHSIDWSTMRSCPLQQVRH